MTGGWKHAAPPDRVSTSAQNTRRGCIGQVMPSMCCFMSAAQASQQCAAAFLMLLCKIPRLLHVRTYMHAHTEIQSIQMYAMCANQARKPNMAHTGVLVPVSCQCHVKMHVPNSLIRCSAGFLATWRKCRCTRGARMRTSSGIHAS